MPDFDFSESSDRPQRRRGYVGHGKSGFWTMFGGSMGCLAAILFTVFLVCAGFAGCLILGVTASTVMTDKSPDTKAKAKP